MVVATPTAVGLPWVERILGQRVDPVTKARAAGAVVERALSGEPGAYVCLTNVHTTVESQRSAALRTAVDAAYLSVPDGMPLAWILRRRGHIETEKVTGIEFIPAVASIGANRGLRHFFYGGAPGVAVRAGLRLEDLVPGINVVGAASPPFADAYGGWPVEELERELLRTRPHVLWIGLGAPKQELLMAELAERVDVPVMVGVGAAFDYLAGAKAAAPTALRHIGLEWLFRLAVEPRRLARRYIIGNTIFLWLLARDALRRRLRSLARHERPERVGAHDRSST
jgi:N-acetylglucosaminyldiphosphoundecaprenol N-acetyl-beta-D-mannosaminyltransferase